MRGLLHDFIDNIATYAIFFGGRRSFVIFITQLTSSHT